MLPSISELYELDGYKLNHIERNYVARNVVYNCEKEGAESKILRISFLNDRSREDYLGEVEYIRYLFEHGGSVSNVVSSRNGYLVEEITLNGRTFYICLFEKAKGKMLVDNNYRYREGAPLAEYFYNCGKVLGRLHQLSKEYNPIHRRYSYFDKFNAEYINKRIPASLTLLKEKSINLLTTLEGLKKDSESYGMIHFDFNDGNYSIDFDTGHITVYDFDNSLFGWYMYDLAGLWIGGTGWIQFEQDAGKRKQFMDDYFSIVLEGYKSETTIADSMLEKLPFFINVNCMEELLALFEDMSMSCSGECSECGEDLSYRIKCMEDDIPYKGFFHDIYSCENPFEYAVRAL